eukprot:TRINITY_DN20515_c0_g1_i1.p1 TRINITY_DN20515_c0_g1~~TRINITY_DN20515_c0_g1_i1.p1  ORF type:complete len:452 (+),score=82.68 TRINITY_DN20515_c0_g1_i1:141-1496(+)
MCIRDRVSTQSTGDKSQADMHAHTAPTVAPPPTSEDVQSEGSQASSSETESEDSATSQSECSTPRTPRQVCSTKFRRPRRTSAIGIADLKNLVACPAAHTTTPRSSNLASQPDYSTHSNVLLFEPGSHGLNSPRASTPAQPPASRSLAAQSPLLPTNAAGTPGANARFARLIGGLTLVCLLFLVARNIGAAPAATAPRPLIMVQPQQQVLFTGEDIQGAAPLQQAQASDSKQSLLPGHHECTEQHQTRKAALECLFMQLDLDQSAHISAHELLRIGQARRQTGQRSGRWTAAQNEAELLAIDQNNDRKVSVEEFVHHFGAKFSWDKPLFESVLAQFHEIGSSLRGVQTEKLSTALEDTSPIHSPVTRRLLEREPPMWLPAVGGFQLLTCGSANMTRTSGHDELRQTRDQLEQTTKRSTSASEILGKLLDDSGLSHYSRDLLLEAQSLLAGQ